MLKVWSAQTKELNVLWGGGGKSLMDVTVMGERTGMGEVVLTPNGTLWRLLSWGREQVWERWS